MLREEEILKPIWKDEKCYCPVCGSTRILRRVQCCLYKVYNENTGKQLNPMTLKRQMSNREKAGYYDCASMDGVGCWNLECRKCVWHSEVFVE